MIVNCWNPSQQIAAPSSCNRSHPSRWWIVFVLNFPCGERWRSSLDFESIYEKHWSVDRVEVKSQIKSWRESMQQNECPAPDGNLVWRNSPATTIEESMLAWKMEDVAAGLHQGHCGRCPGHHHQLTFYWYSCPGLSFSNWAKHICGFDLDQDCKV
jgi:hypothetical protein